MTYPFIQNKYYKWYFNIIKNRSTLFYDGYTEKHHIIPKSLGGTNNVTNLIRLSAQEHFICHLLLIKMTEGLAKYKMVHAANLMKGKRKTNSKIYEMIKQQMIEVRRGIARLPETRKKISEAHKGKILSSETKAKISKSSLGKIQPQEAIEKTRLSNLGSRRSNETKLKMRISHLGKSLSLTTRENMSKAHLGKVLSEKTVEKMIFSRRQSNKEWHSEDTKKKISARALNREKFNCKYCNLEVTRSNLSRWHDEKCRLRSVLS